MKKTFLLYAGLIATMFFAASCASLQQDVFTSTEENNWIFTSTEVYEERFIKIDAQYQQEKKAPVEEINSLLADISAYRQSTNVIEPYLRARLMAFEGLLYKMAGRKRDAETAFTGARSLQKGDRYVQMLECRLAKSTEESLELVEKKLAVDSENPVLQLEKGKLLYQLNKYDKAVSVIDNAFILFDNEGLRSYRIFYNPLRRYIWDLNQVYGSDSSSQEQKSLNDLQQILNLEGLVKLTLENTSLLDNYKAVSQKQKMPALITNIEKAGYFSSAADQQNAARSSEYITGSDEITRKMCARFIWNAYVRSKGNLKMFTAYSEKYRKSGRTKSPLADISVDDADFDAVLGLVEKEIMELPDGKRFEPDLPVTRLQFITWIRKADL